MFIGKLTKEQVEEFLDSIYPKKEGYKFNISISEDMIYVSVENKRDDTDFNLSLEEFDAKISYPNRWLKYLYQVFGEEYREAYLEYCLSVFDD